MKSYRKTVIFDIVVTFVILAVTFFASLVLNDLFEANALIPSMFVLAVFLIALSTDGYVLGLISAILCVLADNYAFTFPYFAFDFTVQENIISAIIMIVITLTTSTLTTKIKKIEETKMEAEKEKMRADLLRAISHDLRTPLTSIYGSSSTVIENYDNLSDKDKIEIVGGIKEDSDWLIRMVENLLSITRIDNSNVKLIKSDVVLEELIDSVLTKFHNRYPNQEVKLDMPDKFIILSADAILIEQVLVNLLENAVEHAKGMTELKLNISQDEKKVTFEVIDNGCGVDKDKIKKIFLGYYMSEEKPKDTQKHYMGIGLSVCSAIIKAHGGTITAKNAESGGMIFRFSIDSQEVSDE